MGDVQPLEAAATAPESVAFVVAISRVSNENNWGLHEPPWRQRNTSVYCFVYVCFLYLLDIENKRDKMVEAAGVEPASENAVSKEPTYLVTFMRRSYPALSQATLRADKKRSRPT